MKITTSVSLPAAYAVYWRTAHQEIMLFAERYLRLCLRHDLRRAVPRRYNRAAGEYAIVTTRFTAAEYDTLHYVASSLRISVSSLVYGIIRLWLKPARRAVRRFFATNYECSIVKWDPEAGYVEENLTFWRLDGENSTLQRNPIPSQSP